MEVRPGYKQTEVGVIPEVWEALPARQVGVFRGGNGFPLTAQGDTSGEYPFFKVSDMNNEGNETFMTTANHYISEQTRRRLGATAFPAESIVFAKVGAAVFLERKKILVQPSCIDNNMAAFVLDQARVDVRFMHSLLLSKKLGALVATTALPALSGRQLGEMTLPVPPLPEQRAIAAALSDVDALLGGLDRLIAKKRDLKQAAMQQLLTGQTRLPGFSGEWEVKRLEEIAELNRLNVVPANEPNRLFLHFSLPAFDSAKSAQLELGATIGSNKFQVPPNSVLVSKLNPRIPRVWAPDVIPENACASTEWLVLTPREGTERTFLLVMCSSPNFCGQMQLAATGTTGSHQRISPNTALGIRVGVPPNPEEQTAIAAVLSDMDAELAALEARRDKTRDLKQAMMQELLTGKTRLVKPESAHA